MKPLLKRRIGEVVAVSEMDGVARSGAKSTALGAAQRYRLIHGDCLAALRRLPDCSVNCIVTSPPYWRQREYSVAPSMKQFLIGQESTPEGYVDRLVDVFRESRRVLADDGSMWLNIGDKYVDKGMVGLPWMVALALKRDGWILRNDVVWNKMKGTQSPRDRLRTMHEYVFHFVKSKKYYYDRKAILVKPRGAPIMSNGKIRSATGVSGSRYREKIQRSSNLTAREKKEALAELDRAISDMKKGKIVDFRMTIRGGQRVYHGSRASISGRAKELQGRGYFMIRMSADGYLPTTVWNIVPEDVQRGDDHCAVFPIELLRVPILSTCPPGGVVLDPFVGTGSTVIAAMTMGRCGVGVDVSKMYVKTAESRIKLLDGLGAGR